MRVNHNRQSRRRRQLLAKTKRQRRSILLLQEQVAILMCLDKSNQERIGELNDELKICQNCINTYWQHQQKG